MFALIGFRKDMTKKVIGTNENESFLQNIAKELNYFGGIRDSSEGFWDREEIKASFFIEEINNNSILQNGINFINYKD